MLFRPSGGRIRKFRIREIPGHFCAISGNSVRPEKNVFTEYALQQVPSRNFGENRDIFGHFFPEMSQILKKVN
jgi:hypothetical protein